MAFVLICFVLPAVLTVKKQDIENDKNTVETEANLVVREPYKYEKFETIKLIHTTTGEIEELPIDTYLYNVVSAEMPADFEIEAIKAQAVVARTYTIYQIIHSQGKHDGADICDNANCCQAWISKEDRLEKWEEDLRDSNWNKIVEAVDSTAGKIITYNGEPIDAFFHSNSGGKTELPVNVWGGADFPYLQSVETAGEEGYEQYSSEVILSKADLVSKLRSKHSDLIIDFEKEDAIKIIEYTDGGRVKTVKFGNIEISGVEARALLGLRSANFEVQIDGDFISFSVKGYGHGVGLSQTGSNSMAKDGSNFEDIIHHFFTGVDITEVNII